MSKSNISAMNDNKSHELRELLQRVPQELYDNIFELVFTADHEVVRNITRDYKPPVQLQVSRATRELFAESYYGHGSSFSLNENVKQWAERLPLEHFDKITCFTGHCTQGCKEMESSLYGHRPLCLFRARHHFYSMREERFFTLIEDINADGSVEYRRAPNRVMDSWWFADGEDDDTILLKKMTS